MASIVPADTPAVPIDSYDDLRASPLQPKSGIDSTPSEVSTQQPAWSFFAQKSRLKSRPKKVLTGLIFVLSALLYGYTLKEVTSIKTTKVIAYYNITGWDQFSLSSLLLGITPAGGCVGAIITALIMRKYKRLSAIYIFTLLHLVAGVIFNITTLSTLVVGKFLQGVSVGYYVTIGPICLREISPIQLRKMLGTFFSFGKILGVMISIGLQQTFAALAPPVAIYWRVLFTMSCPIAILQAVLIFFFVKETPLELLEKGFNEEARKLIQQEYLPQHVQDVYNEYVYEYQMDLAKDQQAAEGIEALQAARAQKKKGNKVTNQSTQVIRVDDVIPAQQVLFKAPSNQIDNPNNTNPNLVKSDSLQEILPQNGEMTYAQKKRGIFWVGLHMTLCRHFTGGSTVITQGGVFLNYFNPTIGKWTDLIVNSIYFLFVVIAVLWIQKCFGKRQFFLFSIPALGVTCFLIAIVMYYQYVNATLGMLCLYMFFYSISFINPAWSYAAEVIPARQSHWVNIVHWVALCLIQLTPPICSKYMYHSNPYPVFFGYGAYAFLCMIHFIPKLRQTTGLGYNQIVKSYV